MDLVSNHSATSGDAFAGLILPWNESSGISEAPRSRKISSTREQNRACDGLGRDQIRVRRERDNSCQIRLKDPISLPFLL
jgi:hypothetical protein